MTKQPSFITGHPTTRVDTSSQLFYILPVSESRTDLSRWRLHSDEGRQTWHYLEDEEAAKRLPQSYAEKWYLGMPTGLPNVPLPQTPLEAAEAGLCFFSKLQLPSGHWACEYGGPMFLIGGITITWYVTETPIPWTYRVEMRNYLFARAHPVDGGWGLHTEAESSALGTAFNYVALRILGVDADQPVMVKARGTLFKLGGATNAPHWTKWWLALLGVVDWDVWVHIREVYVSMSWLYSRRWTMKETDLVLELRKEMLVQPYDQINWTAHRDTIADIDNHHPKPWFLNTMNWGLKNAEQWVAELIDMESVNTNNLGLVPANGPMNMIVQYVSKGPNSYEFRQSQKIIHENLWMKNEGMLCNGTNGVQCWDTSLTIKAVFEARLAQDDKWRPMLVKAHEFLDKQQMQDDLPRRYRGIRHPRKGGWAFSNRFQGYPVSDCVSECLKAVILLQKEATEADSSSSLYSQLLDDQRIRDAVDLLLTFQNASGGCSSYERTRGPKWVEFLNAAEIFNNIMVEYDYPECTTSVLTALNLFHRHWPDYRADDIRSLTNKAIGWIKSVQYPHGGWYGNWGICFTYGTMFALEALATVKETYSTSDNSRHACEFLLSKQRKDGGWGESYRACETHEYVEHPSGSQVEMTAEALIGLMKAEYPDATPLQRGVKLLMDRQQPDGRWVQEAVEGVFNKSTVISYPNYKFHFVIKALGMFANKYSNDKFI
ncbi:terpenoid cyclases/protein prenyltransferase alpha-alpha toroid [Xylariales sp. PMI_506]|nr:terpenoid cyclases/protein prenyltransferase alpha-alpha toroid [Xylariales sp. PMI_506]